MFIDKRIIIGIYIILVIMNAVCISILSLPEVFEKASDVRMQEEYIHWIFLPSVVAVSILHSMKKYWK